LDASEITRHIAGFLDSIPAKAILFSTCNTHKGIPPSPDWRLRITFY